MVRKVPGPRENQSAATNRTLWGVALLLNGSRWRRSRQPLDRALLSAWIWLMLTIGAYFLALVLGQGPALWARRVWFTENEVLHLGLVGWMLYLLFVAAPLTSDLPAQGAASKPTLSR